MNDTVLLVLSDLHATDQTFLPVVATSAPKQDSEGAPSWLDFSDRQGPEQDPIQSLATFMRENTIVADYLVLPGDICDRANGKALTKAWGELESLRIQLGARRTIAASGNHDVDSRYRGNTYDTKAALQGLSPDFPIVEANARAEYWAYHVTEHIDQSVRFIVVDSCAYHGGADDELDHGRISPQALARVKKLVAAPATFGLNVLLCHR